MEQLEQQLNEKMLQIARDYVQRRKDKPFEQYEEANYLNEKYLSVKNEFEKEGDFYIILNDCIKVVLGKTKKNTI
jgi:hypothetical protein